MCVGSDHVLLQILAAESVEAPELLTAPLSLAKVVPPDPESSLLDPPK